MTARPSLGFGSVLAAKWNVSPTRQRGLDRGSVSRARLTGPPADAGAKRFEYASAAAISELVQRGAQRRPHDRSQGRQSRHEKLIVKT